MDYDWTGSRATQADRDLCVARRTAGRRCNIRPSRLRRGSDARERDTPKWRCWLSNDTELAVRAGPFGKDMNPINPFDLP